MEKFIEYINNYKWLVVSVYYNGHDLLKFDVKDFTMVEYEYNCYVINDDWGNEITLPNSDPVWDDEIDGYVFHDNEIEICIWRRLEV